MVSIQKADPKARQRALWLVVFFGCFGGALIGLAQQYQETFALWLVENGQALVESWGLLLLMMFFLFSPPILVGVYMFRIGVRAVREKRYPPKGLAVVRDMPILEGDQAVQRGRRIQILASILVLGSVVVPPFMALIFSTLLNAKA